MIRAEKGVFRLPVKDPVLHGVYDGKGGWCFEAARREAASKEMVVKMGAGGASPGEVPCKERFILGVLNEMSWGGGALSHACLGVRPPQGYVVF